MKELRLQTPEADGYRTIYALSKAIWKQGGQLIFPSDDTLSKRPDVDEVMKTQKVSLEQARAIVLSRKLKEWRLHWRDIRRCRDKTGNSTADRAGGSGEGGDLGCDAVSCVESGLSAAAAPAKYGVLRLRSTLRRRTPLRMTSVLRRLRRQRRPTAALARVFIAAWFWSAENLGTLTRRMMNCLPLRA